MTLTFSLHRPGALLLGAWLVAAGCERKPESRAEPSSSAALGSSPVASRPAEPVATTAPQVDPPGDPQRGKAVAEKFECHRCHEGTGLPAPRREHACIGCHQQIMAGKFPAPAATVSRWQKTLEHHQDAPHLGRLGARFRREWVVEFLLGPRDLRPHLVDTMPRLAITPEEARDVVAWLMREGGAPAAVSLGDASPAEGRQLLETKGCGSCHLMTGAPALPQRPDPTVGPPSQRSAVRLAPDLRHTREQWTSGALVEWLLDPPKVKPGTLMPTHNLTRAEARALARYLLETPLEPAAPKAIPARLPVLTRRVGYDEVVERVLGKTCRHCHGNPDIAMGDGGPGNTGGFGFAPRGLNFASYETTQSGLLDARGERVSVFAATRAGVPRIVAALLARQREEAGEVDPEVRGMPLGLPALGAEEVQLVESWVAQGRPR